MTCLNIKYNRDDLPSLLVASEEYPRQQAHPVNLKLAITIVKMTAVIICPNVSNGHLTICCQLISCIMITNFIQSTFEIAKSKGPTK